MWEERGRSEMWCRVENVVVGDGGWWLAVAVSGGGGLWWGEVGCAMRCGSDNVQEKLFGTGKIMGKRGERVDLNRSRASFFEGERSPQEVRSFALVLWCGRGRGNERSPLGAWRGGERSPQEVRLFASSMCLALWRGFWQTIAPGGRTFTSSMCLALLMRLLQTISPGGAIVRFPSVPIPTVHKSNLRKNKNQNQNKNKRKE
jgi:hypothetical protein